MGQRRKVVQEFLLISKNIQKLCKYAGLHRSCFYYKKEIQVYVKQGRPVPGYTINRDGVVILDQTVVTYLKEYRSDKLFINSGGYYKLTKYLRIEKQIYINHKKIYRLCAEHNLLLDRIKKNRSSRKKRCGYLDVQKPNQLWQFDIKYGYIHGEQKFFYILIFIDVFSKKVIGYHIGKSCKSGDLIFTLDQALKNEGITQDDCLNIRSDNGPQMSSGKFFYFLKRLEQKLAHEFIPPRTPNRNAYVEAFNSILELELLSVRYFRTFGDAYAAVVEFINFYNNRRLHGSIGDLSPKMFIEGLKSGAITRSAISV